MGSRGFPPGIPRDPAGFPSARTLTPTKRRLGKCGSGRLSVAVLGRALDLKDEGPEEGTRSNPTVFQRHPVGSHGRFPWESAREFRKNPAASHGTPGGISRVAMGSHGIPRDPAGSHLRSRGMLRDSTWDVVGSR